MPQSEHDLQAEVVNYLRLNYPDWIIFAVPNGFNVHGADRCQSIVTVKKLIREGLLNGAPDLVCITDKGVFFLELKTQKGYLSDAQKIMQNKMQKIGQKYFVVRSLQEVKYILS